MKFLNFLVKLFKAILSLVGLVVLVGGILYVLNTYFMPAYQGWNAGEFWLSEYSSIGLKDVYVIITSLFIAIGSLTLAMNMKNA